MNNEYCEHEFQPVTVLLRKSDTGKIFTNLTGSGQTMQDIITVVEGLALLIRIAESQGIQCSNGQTMKESVHSLLETSYQNVQYLGIDE